MMKLGQRVKWTSHSGKKRKGKLITKFLTKPLVLVEMDGGQQVEIREGRLDPVKEGE